MSDDNDNEARARAVLEAGGRACAARGACKCPTSDEGELFCGGHINAIAAALSAAETRGRIAGLEEAREIAAKEREVYQYAVEGIAAASKIGKAIDARLAALSTEIQEASDD